ncbi:uncharacterized protein LOC126674630 [Mercurialis annua]|uniref:uncharacterized protein LOC126674630 n=1 Tax=Mercurialis annua TaxID=3986 RepID=UPI00215EB559|nr:uncharacterized protein LOC126674630 [Mercurialis annua]
MDLWVVGAAAAAGYVAKYWKNVSRERDGLSGCKSEIHENPASPIRRLAQKKKVKEDSNTDAGERLSNMYWLHSSSEAESSSNNYVEMAEISDTCDERNVLSLSCLPPEITMDENLNENEGENGRHGNMGDTFCRPCISEMDSCYRSRKKTSSLRTKHRHGRFIKPLNSLESCLMAQLYKEHTHMEEYVPSAFPSPSAKRRPLLVTDGNRVINRLYGGSLTACIGTDDYRLQKDENVCGVPPLPKISKLDVPYKINSKTREVHNGGFNSSCKVGGGGLFRSQTGSPNRTYLFCLGISVGIASSLLASRREVGELQDLLKQTENLVQDLQDELEMKDSLTVKELADENYESLDTCENSLLAKALNPLLSYHSVNILANNDDRESKSEKAEEDSGDMSKIEAELEAELERLGLNMNNGMERRLSNLVELDPDFVADFAQGELKVDIVNRRVVGQPELDRDKSGTPTVENGNYAVSPRELSLRLHEVIESQLEERINQLEVALQNSQMKVKLAESEHKIMWRKMSRDELRYSSGEESPITEQDFNSTSQPLVMNLSGEALDAYNEAYEELMKINESEDDDSPSTLYENSHETSIPSYNQNGSATRVANNNKRLSRESYVDQLKVAIEHSPGIRKLLYEGTSEDENSSSDGEMEKQLIKQIVEKTRKGSPVVLNAQRVLLSMDKK